MNLKRVQDRKYLLNDKVTLFVRVSIHCIFVSNKMR